MRKKILDKISEFDGSFTEIIDDIIFRTLTCRLVRNRHFFTLFGVYFSKDYFIICFKIIKRYFVVYAIIIVDKKMISTYKYMCTYNARYARIM